MPRIHDEHRHKQWRYFFFYFIRTLQIEHQVQDELKGTFHVVNMHGPITLATR